MNGCGADGTCISAVVIVCGTTVSMPDTPANQAAYPQQAAQKEGLGFPIARMVVLLSLATAMVGGMAMGPYAGKETGETALFRELLQTLNAGDILLADRYYCSYFMLALLQEAGIDFAVRLHQLRTADFRRGRRLGKGDHIVAWPRPVKPTWMDDETYRRMPKSIAVREVQVRVSQPGFRVESLVVVTSLTDAATYTTEDIAELYHQRWLAELPCRVDWPCDQNHIGHGHVALRISGAANLRRWFAKKSGRVCWPTTSFAARCCKRRPTRIVRPVKSVSRRRCKRLPPVGRSRCCWMKRASSR